MLLAVALCPTASADEVRLHDKAGSAGPQIRLGDVAEINGAADSPWAQVIVAEFEDDADRATVTVDDVRTALEAEGVNWGRLALGGFARCEVVRTQNENTVDAENNSPIASNTESPIDLDSPMTLRDVAVTRLVALTGAEPGDLRIRFAPRDEVQLERDTLNQRFELSVLSESGLGEVPILVHRIRAGQVVETFHLTADVERRMIALVATEPVGQREAFMPEGVEVRQVWLRTWRGEPLVNPAVVIGQKASRAIREGEVLLPDDIQSPLFVRRGELVTVQCTVGGVLLTTVAKADADGSLGDTITVRNDRTRQRYGAVVIGTQKVSVPASNEADGDAPDARVAAAQGSRD